MNFILILVATVQFVAAQSCGPATLSNGDNEIENFIGKQSPSTATAPPYIIERFALTAGVPFKVFDPFLFCAYHYDNYPSGDDDLGPSPQSLQGRNIGSDFSNKDGWSMYHGKRLPGFPAHPHRGFETVTIAQKGLVDHADSMGGTARYGNGDVQWLTAGAGIQHSEMFPLLSRTSNNVLDLFQIWLNLPSRNKLVPPRFLMMWNESIPVAKITATAPVVLCKVIAGSFYNVTALSPTTFSWASDPQNGVGIAVFSVPAGAADFTIPRYAARDHGVPTRTLYVTKGHIALEGGVVLRAMEAIRVDAMTDVLVAKAPADSEILLLQGVPINEPVASHGPFVMNTQEELRKTFEDYRRTSFGGWRWPTDAFHHERGSKRHAHLSTGKTVFPPEPNL